MSIVFGTGSITSVLPTTTALGHITCTATARYSFGTTNYGPANGYYIDHVKLYVLQQILEMHDELMNDLLERSQHLGRGDRDTGSADMERANAVQDQSPSTDVCRDCPWVADEGR